MQASKQDTASAQPERARDIINAAMRLDPLHPPSYNWILGQIIFLTKRYEDVIRLLIGEELLNSIAHAVLAGSYAHIGRSREAQAALAAFIKQRRHELTSRHITIHRNTINALAGGYRSMWRNESNWLQIVDGLRKAGLSD